MTQCIQDASATRKKFDSQLSCRSRFDVFNGTFTKIVSITVESDAIIVFSNWAFRGDTTTSGYKFPRNPRIRLQAGRTITASASSSNSNASIDGALAHSPGRTRSP